MAKITKVMREKYLENKGQKCPYCSSDDIIAYGEIDGNCEDITATQDMACCTCKKHWTDTFMITKVNGWDIEPDQVDVIASGYEWICPNCQHDNKMIEWTELITCSECSEHYEAKVPEHACGGSNG